MSEHFPDEKEKSADPTHTELHLVKDDLEGGNKEVLSSNFGQYIAGEFFRCSAELPIILIHSMDYQQMLLPRSTDKSTRRSLRLFACISLEYSSL